MLRILQVGTGAKMAAWDVSDTVPSAAWSLACEVHASYLPDN